MTNGSYMERERALVLAVDRLSVSCRTKLNVPETTGIPEITPEGLTDNPCGRLPELIPQV